MKRPLGLVIICFALGIVTGDLASVTILWWLLPGLALAVACVGSARAGPWLLPVLLFASGAANLALNQQSLSPHDLRKLTPPEPILVSVRGEIERVDLRAAVSGDDETLRASARVRVSALADGSAGWRPAHGWVLASTRVTAEPPVRAGQHVELTGVLKPPPEAFARGMFDYRAHLARRAIHRQLEFEGERDVRVLTASPPAWSARFQAWAMGVLGQGFAQGDPAIGMLWALCVGWLVPLTDEVSEPFMRSGTIHVFAFRTSYARCLCQGLYASNEKCHSCAKTHTSGSEVDSALWLKPPFATGRLEALQGSSTRPLESGRSCGHRRSWTGFVNRTPPPPRVHRG